MNAAATRCKSVSAYSVRRQHGYLHPKRLLHRRISEYEAFNISGFLLYNVLRRVRRHRTLRVSVHCSVSVRRLRTYWKTLTTCRNHVLSNGMLAALVFAEVTLAFVLIAYVFKTCGASALQHTKDFEESNRDLSERVIVYFTAEDLVR